MIAAIINTQKGGTRDISLFLNGKPFTVNEDHDNFDEIFQIVSSGEHNRSDFDLKYFEKIVNVRTELNKELNPVGIHVGSNGVTRDGEEIHLSVCNVIMEYRENKWDYSGLVNFLDKLLGNPSFTSRNTIYNYLERYKMPITPDGNFLAMKAVTSDFKDKWTKKIDNSVGAEPEVDRGQVSDNPAHACHYGLHCGWSSYVFDFYGRSGDQIIVVEVDPKDVVCCPTDESYKKIRVCKYKVVEALGEYTEAKGKTFESNLASEESEVYFEREYEATFVDDGEDGEDGEDGDWCYDCDSYEEDCECAAMDALHDKIRADQETEEFLDRLGKKPNGDNYWNNRDENGRFSK